MNSAPNDLEGAAPIAKKSIALGKPCIGASCALRAVGGRLFAQSVRNERSQRCEMRGLADERTLVMCIRFAEGASPCRD